MLSGGVSCTKATQSNQATAAPNPPATEPVEDFSGVNLPAMLNTGPVDPIYEDNQFISIAPIGNFKSIDDLKNSPFYNLLCIYYPALKDIKKVDIDTGQGNLWLICPREENTSLSINEYTQAMFLGSQDEDKGHVYFRTENLRPLIIRMAVDDPGTVKIIAVDNNGHELQWIPTQDPITGSLRDKQGVYEFDYGPSICKSDYDYVCPLDEDGNLIRLRIYDDGLIRKDNLEGHYRIFHLAHHAEDTSGLGLWVEDHYGVECYAEIVEYNYEEKYYVLRPLQGTLFPIGKDLKFTLQH